MLGKLVEKLTDRENGDFAEGTEDEEVTIAGDDVAGLACLGALEDSVVVRIAAEEDRFGWLDDQGSSDELSRFRAIASGVRPDFLLRRSSNSSRSGCEMTSRKPTVSRKIRRSAGGGRDRQKRKNECWYRRRRAGSRMRLSRLCTALCTSFMNELVHNELVHMIVVRRKTEGSGVSEV